MKNFIVFILSFAILFLFYVANNYQHTQIIQLKKRNIINNYNTQNFKYFISIGAISKDETHILREWITHHINEGIDHIYLADNETKNMTQYIATIYDFIVKETVTLYRKEGIFSQYEYYNYFILPKAKIETEWLLIIDTDEFVYAPQSNLNISYNLRQFQKIYKNVSEIVSPYIHFASNHKYEQPRCVIQAYTNGSFQNWNLGKSIVNPRKVYQLAIHAHIINDGLITCSNGFAIQYYNMKDICNKGGCGLPQQDVCNIRSDNIYEYLFIVNHYQLQSLEYYNKVRLKRKDRMSQQFQQLWTEQRWFDLNSSIGIYLFNQLSLKNTVPFCNNISYEENFIGLNNVQKYSFTFTQNFRNITSQFQWKSHLINPNIEKIYYSYQLNKKQSKLFQNISSILLTQSYLKKKGCS